MARRFVSFANGLVNLGAPSGLLNIGGSPGSKTIIAWYKHEGVGENSAGTIFIKGNPINGGRGWELRITHGNGTTNASNSLKMTLGGTTAGQAVGINDTLPSDGKWRFLAGTYTPSDGGPRLWMGDLYSQVAEVTYTAISADARLDVTAYASDSPDNAIIGSNPAGTRDLNGHLAFVGLFNNLLTLQQLESIRMLFLAKDKFTIVDELLKFRTAGDVKINPAGLYFFEEQSFVADYSGNRHQGTLTATQFTPNPFTEIFAREPTIAVVSTVQTYIMSAPIPEVDIALPIIAPQYRLLSPIIEEVDVALPIVEGVDPGVSELFETFTAPDGALGQADFLWEPLNASTRWDIVSNEAAFVGSAFGSEATMCMIPANSENYTVKIPLTKWQRGVANDIALGVIVRKNSILADLTYYAIFVTKTATVDIVSVWRYIQGLSPVQLQVTPIVAIEGQDLEVQVIQLAPPTTQIIARLAGVECLNIADDSIPSGRFFGLHGYLQGTTTSTLLRVDNYRMGVPIIGAPVPAVSAIGVVPVHFLTDYNNVVPVEIVTVYEPGVVYVQENAPGIGVVPVRISTEPSKVKVIILEP